jgi:hypothetical protein
MLSQRTPGATPDDDSTHLQQVLLDLLIHEQPSLWTLAELDRALKPAGEHDNCGCHVEDAVADLYAAGLVHRSGPFVFATRAAHIAERVSA